MCDPIDEIPDTASSTIELSDNRQIKKSPKTLILDASVLSDLRIICISSVCCDLRFYDVASITKFILRIYIRNFPSPLNTFHYHCAADDDDKTSKLIFGDMVGSVRLIHFTKAFKSHFRDGSMMRQISYHELIKVSPMVDVCKIYSCYVPFLRENMKT